MEKMTIPKIIHYCWFGHNQLPELAQKCIASWRKFFPDYEIMEWNEDNFNVNIIPYTAEAYKAKKYAFVSDYARFWILYKYGGLYFDTDVEVIRSMDDIIARGPFMGCENEYDPLQAKKGAMTLRVAPGLGLGVNPGLGLYKEILEIYKKEHFINANGKQNKNTIVQYITRQLQNHQLKQTNEIQQCVDIWIYPKEYFCPIDYITNKMEITKNTRSIHHYAASWTGKKQRIYLFVARYISLTFASFCSAIVKKLTEKR